MEFMKRKESIESEYVLENVSHLDKYCELKENE